MSDINGPVIVLHALKVQLGQLHSFTGVEYGDPHARAVHMAMGPVREVAGCDNWQQLPELLPGGFHTSSDHMGESFQDLEADFP